MSVSVCLCQSCQSVSYSVCLSFSICTSFCLLLCLYVSCLSLVYVCPSEFVCLSVFNLPAVCLSVCLFLESVIVSVCLCLCVFQQFSTVIWYLNVCLTRQLCLPFNAYRTSVYSCVGVLAFVTKMTA